MRIEEIKSDAEYQCYVFVTNTKNYVFVIGMHTSNYLLEYHKNMFKYIELEGA